MRPIEQPGQSPISSVVSESVLYQNQNRTELEQNHLEPVRTARNFEKCTLHKFYTLKLIAASYLCLNFFVLMLFEGTSARKHEIDKELSYLAMTNHSKLRKPCW